MSHDGGHALRDRFLDPALVEFAMETGVKHITIAFVICTCQISVPAYRTESPYTGTATHPIAVAYGISNASNSAILPPQKAVDVFGLRH